MLEFEDIYSQIIKTGRFETNFSNNYRAVLNVLEDIKDEFADAQKYFPVDNKIDGDVITSNIRMFAKPSGKDMFKLNSKTDDMEIINAASIRPASQRLSSAFGC